jgi:hypothetical protein
MFRLDETGDDMRFYAEFDLVRDPKLKLPGKARVYIEAYRRVKYQRFNFGTVDAPSYPHDTSLTEFTSDDKEYIQFRVKVVDQDERQGRLIAYADGLRWVDKNGVSGGRSGLLDTALEEMGDRVWKLDLEGNKACLLVNKDINNPFKLVRSDMFFGVVYPQILERILSEILIFEREEDWAKVPVEDDPDRWQVGWLKFARSLLNENIPAQRDINGRKEWISSCVDKFCKKHRLFSRTNSSLKQESN